MILGIIGIAVFFLILSIIIGAVYVPSVDWVIDDMISLSVAKKGDVVVDLGSGNGKVVIAFAKKGIEAHGYEINPLLVLWSLFLVWKAGVWGKVHIHWKNFFSADLSQYSIITVFVVPYIMGKVEKKVLSDARAGTRILVETFPFPNLKPVEKKRGLYLYKIG